MKPIIIVVAILLAQMCLGQDKKVIIKDNHAKISVTLNEYNSVGRDAILNVSKYIDTSKTINLFLGDSVTVSGFIPLNALKKGYDVHPLGGGSTPGGIILRGGDKIISLKLVHGKLKISCEILGFDQKYIAEILENKLVTSRSDYHLYVSDRYFEVFDDYYIPVLQIELIKKYNAIYIGGSFVDERGYTIISKGNGFTSKHFINPILLMRSGERDSALYNYLAMAKKMLTPIHE